jgi:two-component system LytT family sensor kinase
MIIKPINKKLFTLAFITSPLLAIYGVSPLFIFDKINFIIASTLCFFIFINILLIWLINIFIYNKLKRLSFIKKATIGFLFTLLTQTPKLFVKPDFAVNTGIDQYLAYPAIFGVAMYILIWIIINAVDTSNKKNEFEALVNDLKIANVESQQKILSQQIQPHFLFNALSTLKSLIIIDKDKAENYILELSNFLRYSIQSSQLNVSLIEDELSFTQNYINLQKMRFDKALIVSINFEKDEYLKKKIPVFALQLLVENAIKHNNFSDRNPLKINIEIEDEFITVFNSKSVKDVIQSTKTGLQNLNQRYQLIANKSIDIQDTETTFKVKINSLTK